MKRVCIHLVCFALMSWISACQNVKSIEDGADSQTLHLVIAAQFTDSSGNPIPGAKIQIDPRRITIFGSSSSLSNLQQSAQFSKPAFGTGSDLIQTYVADGNGFTTGSVSFSHTKFQNGRTTFKATMGYGLASGQFTNQDMMVVKKKDLDTAYPGDQDYLDYSYQSPFPSPDDGVKVGLAGAVTENTETVKRIISKAQQQWNSIKNTVSCGGTCTVCGVPVYWPPSLKEYDCLSYSTYCSVSFAPGSCS